MLAVPHSQHGRARAVVAYLVLLATAIAVDLLLAVVYTHFPGDPLVRTLAPAFPVSYKNWLIWAAFLPLVMWLVRRLVAAHWRSARRVAVTIVLGIALAVMHAVIEMWFHRAQGMRHMLSGGLASYHFFHGLLTYSAVFAVALLMESDRAARERERRAVQLQKEVTDAQLQMLRMQIQPHFLFNTLNSISALVDQDVRGGQRMIGRLSDFLRLTLNQAGHQYVPLREELRLLDTYIEIQRARFGDRLRVDYEIDDEALEARIPNLLLQPLVENAIRHGIEPALAGGSVSIRAHRDGDHLVVEVLDDGVGADPARLDGGGTGLRNARERLRQCYGPEARLEIFRRTPAGTAVVQRIPWRVVAPTGGHA